ncbi:MAG: thiamine biosynthesis lipoprotein [Cellvibrionaceae bacterium]|jgi:thiamine biosynthesis lipoprotein
MGSPCEFSIYCDDEQKAKRITQLLSDEISRLENKYTRYKTTSVTSAINDHSGKVDGIRLDEETAALINYADSLYQQSDGLFDITSGVLRREWNFKSGKLPRELSMQALLPIIGWDKVTWDNPHFYLPIEGMEVDFGGFVKEYAADVLATLCIDNSVKHGLINLGGDIRVIGSHPNGSPWRVGIQHPRKPLTAIATVDMYSGGIATSGDYERYMIIDGKRYCHLLNPKTGESIQPYFASVSVVSESCLLAGSFSSIAMLKSQKDKGWLNDMGLPYLTTEESSNQTIQLAGTLSHHQSKH